MGKQSLRTVPGRNPPSDLAAVPPRPSNGVRVAMKTVTDVRPDPKNLIGYVRNGFYMHTADVLTSDDVAGWATGALRMELEWAGLDVVEPGPATPVLGADLSKIFCDAYWHYNGAVSLRVWVDDANGHRLLEKVFETEDTQGMNWAASESGYGQCAAFMLQKVARQMAADVKSALQGAVPAPAPSASRFSGVQSPRA